MHELGVIASLIIIYGLAMLIIAMITCNLLVELTRCRHIRGELHDAGKTVHCDQLGLEFTSVPYQKHYCPKCRKIILWLKYESGWRPQD